MFEIRDIFHLTHVVDDLDTAVAWYDDVFAPRHWMRSHGPGGTPMALLAVGDVVMMPMVPAPGVTSPASKFRERFGTHLHSMGIYVDDAAELVDHLTAQGLRLAGSNGQPLAKIEDEIWTRGREAPCLFEFIEYEFMVGGGSSGTSDPRSQPDWSSAYWRDEHPLGLDGSACLTVVTEDRDAGRAFFTDTLRGKILHESASTPFGTASSFVSMGPRLVAEVAQPVDGASRAAADLERCGGIFHAVTFKVADAGRAAEHLESKGVKVDRPAPGHVAVDPATAQGVQFRFTDRDITTS